MQLNYNHLRYFQEVALEGNLTRAANRLNISQSALSIQIKQLEARIGHNLFDRAGRNLKLTEAGKIALDHAKKIFAAGDDLIETLQRRSVDNAPLRIGALSTLSRNFQLQFLEPMLSNQTTRFVLKSGDLDTLYRELSALALDLVLTTEPPEQLADPEFEARLINRQSVTLIGKPGLIDNKDLSEIIEKVPLIVPSDNPIRTGLSRLVSQHGLTPNISAEVDDMAMVRLLTRAGFGVALSPAVVLADEIRSGLVVEAPYDLGITEDFYAVTSTRLFPHPSTSKLLEQKLMMQTDRSQ
ncbi:MAG: LysR family transcriptional regulator [Pseudomonadota bacterium]